MKKLLLLLMIAVTISSSKGLDRKAIKGTRTTCLLEPPCDIISNTKYSEYEIIVWFIKSTESLHLKPYWDISQYTHGWGTKAKGSDDVITLQKANEYMRKDFEKRYQKIKVTYPKLTRWEQLVISSLTFNVGMDGIGKGLNIYLKKGEMKKAAKKLLEYCNVTLVDPDTGEKYSERSPGLLKRRKLEAKLLLMTDKEDRYKVGKKYQLKTLKRIRVATSKSKISDEDRAKYRVKTDQNQKTAKNQESSDIKRYLKLKASKIIEKLRYTKEPVKRFKLLSAIALNSGFKRKDGKFEEDALEYMRKISRIANLN